jgi:hypothetical protein
MERRTAVTESKLFNPATAEETDWPPNAGQARAFICAVAKIGPTALASNIATQWRALRSGDRVFPVTINDGQIGGSYVCLPHSAYSLYATEELHLVATGWMKAPLSILISIADRLLRAADINRVVHVDNWLLSTNLHGDWDGSDEAQIRDLLIRLYPRHIIAVRSVDAWTSPTLYAALRGGGWCLLPSRQIWVTDDLPSHWTRRRDTVNDRRVLKNSGLITETVDKLDALRPGDAERITTLYTMLYLQKYSQLNPAFTEDWVRMSLETGLIRYHLARDDRGMIQAVAGTYSARDVQTTPIVGYDTTRPQSEGLYRIACLMAQEEALTKGLRVNGSAGAAAFKRNRGAQGVIEYSAFWTAHLSFGRRMIIRILAGLLNTIAVPYMKRKQL